MKLRSARLAILAALVLGLVLLPSVSHAQTPAPGEDDDVLIRINGDVHIGIEETMSTVIVINGDVFVEGTIESTLVLIEGTGLIAGSVGENVTVVSGDLALTSGGQVNDVRIFSGGFEQREGTVTGDVREQDSLGIGGWDVFFVTGYLWLASTVIALVGGLIFAAIGGAQLTRAAMTMTGQLVSSIVGAVFLWVGVPILAGLILLTIIGIPLGIGVLLFLLPVLAFLGYLVAGARLGLAVLGRFGRTPGTRPLAATALGVLILQLVLLIPFLGFVVTFIASLWGGGALAFTAFRAAGGRGFESSSEPATT